MSSFRASRDASGMSRAPVVRRLGAILAAALGLSLLGSGLVATPAVAAEPAVTATDQWPETVTADPLPTVQIDGVVWSQAAVGNKVYAGGEFANARPAGAAAGTNETARQNLLAYNLQTGVLDTSWNPGANGKVSAIAASPDGTRLYVAGTFTTIAGETRYRVAQFNTATGQLTTWRPVLNGSVTDVKATNTTVYFTGNFSSVNNISRPRIAAVSASNATLVETFAPVLDGGYGGKALAISPDGGKVVVAGSFLSTNGSTTVEQGRGISALDAVNGNLLEWKMSSVLHNAGESAAMYSLNSDGESVYGTGYDYSGSNVTDRFEGSYRARWSDGSMVWMEDCHGDTYGVAPLDGVVYVAGHAHYCGNIGEFPQEDPWHYNHSLGFAEEPSGTTITPDIWGYRSFTGNPAAKLLPWYPIWTVGSYTGSNQAGWTVASAGDYLLYGGEFKGVAGVNQQGLVRFAKRDIAPKKIGPSIKGGNYKITAASFIQGRARIAWPANYDPDNAVLTYDLLRQGTTTPIYTTTATSSYWVRPLMNFTDTAVNPGQTYQYRVRVTDSDGNNTVSDWTPVTVASEGSETAYNGHILSVTNPIDYWPLGEASGTAAFDWISGDDLSLAASGITRGATGPSGATATSFSGADQVSGATTVSRPGPQVFSLEAWFRTTSTTGGKIVGFGNSQTGDSTSYDRHIYLSNSGAVTFGVYPNATRTLTSAAGLNNGQWHHVVGTLSSAGMALYVDGSRVGFRSDTTSAQGYNGYWRVGGDNQGGWSNTGSSKYFNGDISDVAVYDRALTAKEIDGNWVASGRTTTLPTAPADAYGKSVFDLGPSIYWRLGETSGTTAVDAGPERANGTYRTAGFGSTANKYLLGQAGALSGVSNTAVRFNESTTNSSYGYMSSNNSYQAPNVFSLETWFKTTSTAGGNLLGFGSSQTGTSSNHDRHVYMTSDGTVKFGVWTGQTTAVVSAPGYNNGQWHHVVATMSGDGQRLYLDGVLVDSNTNSIAEGTTGYWRVAGDTAWEGATWWKGYLDEVAIYPQAITADQVQQHFSLGRNGVPNSLPTASFTAAASDLVVAFDSTGSSDPDGDALTYAWDFDGNGTTDSTVANPTYTYPGSGTYTAKLTVTDVRGASASYSAQVTVLAPNVNPVASFTITQDPADSPEVSFASTSTDPDGGAIVTSTWNFGDGTANDVGPTTSHSYSASGDYTVSLTVTDDRGGSNTRTESVHVVVPNTPPTADFTIAKDGLSVDVTATASDVNGDPLTYSWDFGDGGTAQGASASHTYTVAEETPFTIVLTVSDGEDETVVSKPVTVAPIPNAAPVASFTLTRNGLGISVNAAGSSDSDGDPLTYSWVFGDGGTASGVTATHTYEQVSVDTTYQVVLTVSDGEDSDTATRSVTLTPPPTEDVIAQDTFSRTATGAWGTADKGGAWTLTGGNTAFSVTGGTGIMALAKGGTRGASLTGVTGTSSVTAVQISSNVASAGGAASAAVVGRQVGSDFYSAKLRFETDGSIKLQLLRTSGGEALLASSYTVASSYTPGAVVNVVLSVTGTSPTAIAAKAWLASSAEPSSWQREATDSTASLQTAGSIGLRSTVASTSTVTTTQLAYDNYKVTTGLAPAPNAPPVAAFDSNVNGLAVSFDASSSSDADGDTLTYAWDFGDGSTGTGKSPSHTYSATQSTAFQVSLTVSDGEDSDSVTHSVTVAPPVNNAPKAVFVWDANGLVVKFDAKDSSDADGDSLTYAWDFNDGENGTGVSVDHTFASAGDYNVKLTVSDGDKTDSSTVKVSVSELPPPPTEEVVAKDDFERTATGAWGTADKGGNWTLSGGSAAFSVAGGQGRVTLAKGGTRAATLNDVTGTSTVVDVKVSSDVASQGGVASATIAGREVSAASYGVKVRFEADGTVRFQILRKTDSEVILGGSYTLSGTYTPGAVLNVRFSVTGTSPTTVAAKAWYQGDDEPAAWQRQVTDTTAALQVAGHVSLKSAVASTSTVATTVIAYDAFKVTKLA